MATRLVGVDTADPRLPTGVVTATQGTSAADFAAGNVAVNKADKSTTISTTAPLAGGGDLSTNRTLTITNFTSGAAGAVPASGGGTTNYLRADATWATPAGGGGGITTEDAVDAVAAALLEGVGIDIAYDDGANTITVAGVTFTDVAAGVVPLSGGGTGNFLRADGTWALPPGAGGTVGHTSYTHNATLTEPPATSQLRFNNATQTAATRVWVSQNDVDGLDVSLGLSRILPGHQIYIQDYDDASKWIKYNVTAVSDDGAYYDFTVTYHSGPGGIPAGSGAAGRVEFQPVLPGTVGVPPGGTTGQVMAKTSSADYAVTWDTIDKTDVGLSNADNTADTAKPVSTATQTALDLKQDKSQTINAQTGTTYTLVLTDAGKIITLSNASAITLTVPTNASVAFPVGTSIDLIQLAAGQFTVTGAGPPTISKAMATAKSRTQYSVMTLIKTATDVWILTGDAAAS